MGVVEHALAGAEQTRDQIAIAQLLVGNTLHHVRMRGIIGAVEHRASPLSRGGARSGAGGDPALVTGVSARSDEHTSELQSLMRTSYAVFCLQKQLHLSFSLYFYIIT